MEEILDELVPPIIKNLSVKDFFHFGTTAQKFTKFLKEDNIWQILWNRDYPSDVIVISDAEPVQSSDNYNMIYSAYKLRYQAINRYITVQIFDNQDRIQKTVLCQKEKRNYPIGQIQRFLFTTYRDTPICQFISSGLWFNLHHYMGTFSNYLSLQFYHNVQHIGADKIRLLKEEPTHGRHINQINAAANALLIKLLNGNTRPHHDEMIRLVETEKKLFEYLIRNHHI